MKALKDAAAKAPLDRNRQWEIPMARRLGEESKTESGPEIHWSLVSASS